MWQGSREYRHNRSAAWTYTVKHDVKFVSVAIFVHGFGLCVAIIGLLNISLLCFPELPSSLHLFLLLELCMDRHDNLPRRAYDPRIGDEDGEDSPIQDSDSSPRIDKPEKPDFVKQESSKVPKESAEKKSWRNRFTLPSSLAWIPPSWTWPKWKIVLRCAVAGWASLVLMVINPILRTMGQVCCLDAYSICRLTCSITGWISGAHWYA